MTHIHILHNHCHHHHDGGITCVAARHYTIYLSQGWFCRASTTSHISLMWVHTRHTTRLLQSEQEYGSQQLRCPLKPVKPSTAPNVPTTPCLSRCSSWFTNKSRAWTDLVLLINVTSHRTSPNPSPHITTNVVGAALSCVFPLSRCHTKRDTCLVFSWLAQMKPKLRPWKRIGGRSDTHHVYYHWTMWKMIVSLFDRVYPVIWFGCSSAIRGTDNRCMRI